MGCGVSTGGGSYLQGEVEAIYRDGMEIFSVRGGGGGGNVQGEGDLPIGALLQGKGIMLLFTLDFIRGTVRGNVTHTQLHTRGMTLRRKYE